MSNITVIDQNLPDFLQQAGVSELTKQLAGKSGVKRLVPKNGIFRKMVGGEEMGKVKGALNAVVVNASPKVGRIFYAKQWSPDSEPTAPDCFSNDGVAPDQGAANPQASACNDCQQNIKGSGMGSSKACRYSRRIAVVLEEDFNTSLSGEVYQMNLASKSLFGDSNGDNTHTFENYTKYLANNGKSIDHVITQISFNEDNDNQSVLFTPVRFINRNEYEVTSKVIARPEVQKMVTMTPYQADASGRAPKLEAPKAAAESEPEPKKRESKKAAETPAAKKDLDSVLKAWSDGE
ncbi:hypothetical protein EBT31_11425 [bacterium]|nr:hypothetical protein [bacterium]